MRLLYYLLEANLYLAIGYAFYRLLLYRETFYQLNRHFLLGATLFSFLLPLIGTEKQAAEREGNEPLLEEVPLMHEKAPNRSTTYHLDRMPGAPVKQSADFMEYLPYIYLLVSIAFLSYLGKGLYAIFGIYRQSPKQRHGQVTHVFLKQEGEAYSFFNWLFYHPEIASKEVIIAHEMEHVHQKHSLDVVWLEMVKVICWLNPVCYWLLRDAKLNHEYLADESARGGHISAHHYALLLINHAVGPKNPMPLVHNLFNHKQLKKRIMMMNQKKSTRWARLKFLLAVPLCLALFAFSAFTIEKDYALIRWPQKAQQPVWEHTSMATFDQKQLPSGTGTRGEVFSILEFGNGEAYITGEDGIKKYLNLRSLNKYEFLWLEKKTGHRFKKPRYDTVTPIKGKPPINAHQSPAVKNTENLPHFEVPRILPNSRLARELMQEEAQERCVQDSVQETREIAVTNYDQTVAKKGIVHFKNSFKDEELVEPDPRYILVNGKEVDKTKVYGIRRAASIKFLPMKEALQKYGDKGKHGAIEIIGKEVEHITEKLPPPPPVEPPPAKRAEGQPKLPEVREIPVELKESVLEIRVDLKESIVGHDGNSHPWQTQRPDTAKRSNTLLPKKSSPEEDVIVVFNPNGNDTLYTGHKNYSVENNTLLINSPNVFVIHSAKVKTSKKRSLIVVENGKPLPIKRLQINSITVGHAADGSSGRLIYVDPDERTTIAGKNSRIERKNVDSPAPSHNTSVNRKGTDTGTSTLPDLLSMLRR